MSSKKKNQHFVPRFVLRKFSRDGKNVSLVVLATGRLVPSAPIGSQCARDYFYGEDPALEDAFSDWEGKIAAMVRDLDVPSLQRLMEEQLYQLRQFVHYQGLRTEGAADSINRMVDSITKSVFRESPNGVPEGLDRVTIGLKGPQHLALHNAAVSTPLLLDLQVKFLVRTEPPGFLISDDPNRPRDPHDSCRRQTEARLFRQIMIIGVIRHAWVAPTGGGRGASHGRSDRPCRRRR
jgi:hypothetical protein